LKPAEDRGYGVEVNEETGIRHLVQGRKCAHEGRNSAILKYDSQQEVLQVEKVNQLQLPVRMRGIYPERHHESVQDNDKQEFEEVGGVRCETRHPICAKLPDQSPVDGRWTSDSHGANNDIRNDPQRDSIEDESR